MKDVVASYDILISLFERIHFFLQRLNCYTNVALTTEMTELLGKIMAQVLSVLALSTKTMKERWISELPNVICTLFAEHGTEKLFKRLTRRTDIEDALQRLDTLTREEGLMTAARNLQVTHHIADNVASIKEVIHGVDDSVNVIKGLTSEVDGNVKAIKGLTNDVDGNVKVIKEVVGDVDNNMKATKELTHDVNSNVTTIKEVIHDVNSNIKATAQLTNDVNNNIISVKEVVHEVDSNIKATKGLTHEVNNNVTTIKEVIHEVDGDIKATKELTHEVDSNVISLKETVHDVDSNLRATKELTYQVADDTKVVEVVVRRIDDNLEATKHGMYCHSFTSFALLILSLRRVKTATYELQRSSLPHPAIIFRPTETRVQETSLEKSSGNGSLHRTPPSIIMLPATPTTRGPQRGLPTAIPSTSGREMALYCGSVGIVRCAPTLTIVVANFSFNVTAGSGKSILWCAFH
jgi:methyl-accepting chemotaxis protein